MFQQPQRIGFIAAFLFLGLSTLMVFGLSNYFIQINSTILSLLPLGFVATYYFFDSIKSDKQVITPKNIMLFIWLNKLVIIPVELMTIGNKVAIFDIKNQTLSTEITITLCAFLAFVLGWSWHRPTSKLEIKVSDFKNSTIYLSIIYVLIGLVSIIAIYGSIQHYFTGAWLTYITKEVIEKATGNTVGYLANVGQRFLPFGIMLAWVWWQQRLKKWWTVNLVFVFICFLSTLSSNRSNMIYPLLAFVSVLLINWQTDNKIWLLMAIFGLLFLTFFFGFVRVQPQISSEQVGMLFDSYMSDNDYVWYAHQIYLGTPYQITPLLHTPPSNHSMLLASVLDPVPAAGKYFREHSGSFIYNLTLYESTISQDKTIPVAGELFYEGGYGLVVGVHFLIGWTYARLDWIFKQNLSRNLAVALSIFYLALLFNATLLLSVSVLVQFLIYNAAPALFILLYERTTRIA